MGCVFCEILAGKLPSRKVWENDRFIAIFPLAHVNPGHTLLIPKIHVDYVFDLEPTLYKELWEHANMLSEPIRLATGAKRIGIAVEGFSVPHVHVHLVPINNVAELDPHREKRVPDLESDRLQSAIIANLPN
jgi:histidine triad (HIT) family protein